MYFWGARQCSSECRHICLWLSDMRDWGGGCSVFFFSRRCVLLKAEPVPYPRCLGQLSQGGGLQSSSSGTWRLVAFRISVRVFRVLRSQELSSYNSQGARLRACGSCSCVDFERSHLSTGNQEGMKQKSYDQVSLQSQATFSNTSPVLFIWLCILQPAR